MKKILKTMTAALVITTALAVSASAANFDHCADALKGMGLFQGSAQGYELDRAPTRGEAATMLVRLLGKETAAKELTYSAPFTDLEGWQQPYVQYLYENKLTTGATATTFTPGAKCDAKMYTTFLLRALGYDDASGDFSYEKSLDKAKELGLVDAVNCDEKNFLRDNVVAMSYTALAEQPKGETKTTLLEKLVADGAVTKEQAAPMTALVQDYADFSVVNASYAKENKTAMKMNSTVNTKMNGKEYMSMTMQMNISADMNLADMNKSKMAMTGKMDAKINPAMLPEGSPAQMQTETNTYYTDGMAYTATAGQKSKMPMDFSALQASMDLSSYSSLPLSAIKSLSVKSTGAVKTYTLAYVPGVLNDIVDGVLGTMGMPAGNGMQTQMMSYDMMVSGGKIIGMNTTAKMSMTAGKDSAEMDMVTKCTDIQMGSGVTVTLPTDLATYVDAPAPSTAA